MNDRATLPSLENSAFFMPFSMNRHFKKAPRLLARAEGIYYYTPEGRKLIDGSSGLWCVNAGHCREKIVKAVQKQVAELDFAPTFQMGHPLAFEFADKVASLAPGDLKRVFFTNSGSESVDTALKLALAYHRARGEGHRVRLIGRERGYHGVNFGGTAVGGMVGNRKIFGALVTGVDHIRHTHDLEKNAFSRGQPKHGAELADDLERLCALHDPSTIAAVIVEPVACSGGVLVPPVGYLERLRAICDKHGILLIFDEVITGWGRLGKTFGTQYFNVMPDMITTAQGICVPVVLGRRFQQLGPQRGVGEGTDVPGVRIGVGDGIGDKVGEEVGRVIGRRRNLDRFDVIGGRQLFVFFERCASFLGGLEPEGKHESVEHLAIEEAVVDHRLGNDLQRSIDPAT
jgi:beta-alanine--pyruvate transaminase